MAKSTKEVVQAQEKPLCTSPEWNDYVVGHFVDEELVEGHPTVAGLRRVAELFLGPIVESGPEHVWPTLHDNLGRATVLYMVKFEDGKKFSDVADVWAGNIDDAFAAYAVAVAATRAEARALRKALKLRVVASEELSNKVQTVSESATNNDLISINQINFIDTRCKAMNINVVQFMNAGERTYRSVNEVMKTTATKMIKELNRLFNEPESIPAEIRGYKADWQSNFKG